MIENVKCLGHSTIKIKDKDKIIYIDPYNIREDFNDGDYIFITHNHYDHYSEEDIKKVKKENTIIVITEDLYNEVLNLGIFENKIIKVRPDKDYEIDNCKFSTIPSYNTNKKFHPRSNNWVGYILNIDNVKYYIAGDTDITEENKKVICDVAFLPVGGTYTMDYKEAAELANTINPKIVIPIHYGIVVGTKEDAFKFKNQVNENIKCEIMY